MSDHLACEDLEASDCLFPRELWIRFLVSQYEPPYFCLIDDSSLHRSFFDFRRGKMSHVRLTLVSEQFEGQSLVDRLRRVEHEVNEVGLEMPWSSSMRLWSKSQWENKKELLWEKARMSFGEEQQVERIFSRAPWSLYKIGPANQRCWLYQETPLLEEKLPNLQKEQIWIYIEQSLPRSTNCARA